MTNLDAMLTTEDSRVCLLEVEAAAASAAGLPLPGGERVGVRGSGTLDKL
jgi:hypothetical protein